MNTADVVEAVMSAGLSLPAGVYRVERTLSVPNGTVPLTSRAAEDELLELARAHGTVDKDDPAATASEVDAASAGEDGRDVTGENAGPVRGKQSRQHGEGDGDAHTADGTRPPRPWERDLYDEFGRIPRTWQEDH